MKRFFARMVLALARWVQGRTEMRITYYQERITKLHRHRLVSSELDQFVVLKLKACFQQLYHRSQTYAMSELFGVIMELRSIEVRYAHELYEIDKVVAMYEIFIEAPGRAFRKMIEQ